MKTGIKNFITSFLVFITPILSILFLEIFFYIPRINEFYNHFRLAPFYTGIYFWLSLRRDAFTLLSAFILGIFADVLSSSTLGINMLSFLVLYLISDKIFSYFNIKKFSYSWLLFSLALLITLLFKAIIVSTFHLKLIPLNHLLLEYVLTTMLYPLIGRFYLFVENRYIHLEERYENQQ